jgi:hypothetical protein
MIRAPVLQWLRLVLTPFCQQNKAVAFGQRPQPLRNCYTQTDAFVRWGMAVTYNRHKFVTAALLKRLLRNGGYTSETAVRRFQKRNGYLDPEVLNKNPLGLLGSFRCNSFSRRRDKRGYRNMCKIAGRSVLNLSHWYIYGG